MKKMTVLLGAGAMLLISLGLAHGHSEWAKYKENPVPEDVTGVPAKYVGTTINCCDCHTDPRFPGPEFPECR